VDADIRSYSALMADPETTQWIGGTRTESEAGESVVRMRNGFHRRGWGTLAVVPSDTPDADCIGYCGVRPLPHTQDVELAFGFLKSHWNQGFAAEAGAACLDAAFQTQRFSSVVATVYPDNTRSLAVLRKLHMKDSGRIFGHWPKEIALLFRVTLNDWEQKHARES
jgi:RimJ/RimL family protein N-acetyltransferase